MADAEVGPPAWFRRHTQSTIKPPSTIKVIDGTVEVVSEGTGSVFRTRCGPWAGSGLS
jgi:hypothetical protein